MTHHDDHIAFDDDGPDLRTLRQKRHDWRTRHGHLIPARLRHIPGIIHEPMDMLWSMAIVGGLAAVVALALDMTR